METQRRQCVAEFISELDEIVNTLVKLIALVGWILEVNISRNSCEVSLPNVTLPMPCSWVALWLDNKSTTI